MDFEVIWDNPRLTILLINHLQDDLRDFWSSGGSSNQHNHEKLFRICRDRGENQIIHVIEPFFRIFSSKKSYNTIKTYAHVELVSLLAIKTARLSLGKLFVLEL